MLVSFRRSKHRPAKRRRDPVVRMLEPVVVVCTIFAVIAIVQPWRDATGGRQAQAAPASGFGLYGEARVIDGDTLDLAGERIRLHAIDAFEADQRCGTEACGQRAEAALNGLIADREVRCEPRDTDRYGRLVAVCHVGGVDMNGWMVARGHAVAYERYGTDYVDEERTARLNRVGAWKTGRFEDPEDWRHAR